MSALLWITAAIMQLAAVVLYYVVGFGVGFVILQVFVIFTGALVILALAASSRSSRESSVTRIVRGR